MGSRAQRATQVLLLAWQIDAALVLLLFGIAQEFSELVVFPTAGKARLPAVCRRAKNKSLRVLWQTRQQHQDPS